MCPDAAQTSDRRAAGDRGSRPSRACDRDVRFTSRTQRSRVQMHCERRPNPAIARRSRHHVRRRHLLRPREYRRSPRGIYNTQRNSRGMEMKRSLALPAILTLVMPLSARAESGNVQIYGTINVDYESVQATGASPAAVHAPNQLGATPTGIDVPHRDRVTSNSSNIGFRGMQPLGAGLKAIFQMESAEGYDNHGTSRT